MTKEQKIWHDWGYSDQSFFKYHPEALLQNAWFFFLKDIDNGVYSWDCVFNNFPYYKNGVLKATKDLKLEY